MGRTRAADLSGSDIGVSTIGCEGTVAFNARKTEHAGPKKGRGAFYGRKAAAKAQSNRRRRENAKLEVRASVEHPEGVLTPNKSLHLTGELLMLASLATISFARS